MKIRRNDVILLGGILVLALGCFLAYRFFPREPGFSVLISIDGKVSKTFPLKEDRTYTIKTGKNENILQIKNGSASIIEANCPDKLCVKQHAISKKGETLVCLPHKTVISIAGKTEDESSDDFDSIVR